MALAVSITLQTVYTKLRALLVDVLPVGLPIIQGLGNRVPMPPRVPGFVSMTVNLNKALRTPIDTWDHASANPASIAIEQGMQIRIQLDCYGPESADWAVIITTILRNDYAFRLLAPVSPLFADDPVQAALTKSEEQYEERWIVGANLQYNPVVTTPMQFANVAQVDLINIDEAFPP